MVKNETPNTVTVVYATRDAQPIVTLKLEAGLTAEAAVSRSGLLARFPEIDTANLCLGIFGIAVDREQELQAGDRVEICRPLENDPRNMRRELLASGKVMGGKSKTTVQA